MVRGEIDQSSKDYQIRSCVARSVDKKLVKPLRVEKNKNGKTRSPNSIKFDDWEEFTLPIQMMKNTEKSSKNARRKLERLMAPAMPCKRSQQGITKVLAKSEIASEKNSKTVYGCMVAWLHGGIL